MLNTTWFEAFEACIEFMKEKQCLLSGMTLELYKKLYGVFGFEYSGISNTKGTKRPTIKSFAASHKKGMYILNVAHHQVAVVDGYYYDTWDCGEKSLYGYFEKKDIVQEEKMQKENKGKIIEKDGVYRYSDRDGIELFEGDIVEHENGKREGVYMTENGELGINATNPLWIEMGRAVACEYRVYPLNNADVAEMKKVL